MSGCENCPGCGASAPRPLSCYRVGFRGRIRRILPAGDSRKRMLEMGLTPGTEIEILGTAPMGDPLEVLLRGYRLSLRRSEADLVEVDVLKRAGSV